MTQIDNAKPPLNRLVQFDVVVARGFVLIEVAAVVDALRIANRVTARPMFNWTYRSHKGGLVESLSRATVQTEPFEERPEADYLFAIGSSNQDEPDLSLGPGIDRYTYRGAQVYLLAEAASRYIRERGAERLVVDLRGNGGGMNAAAVLLYTHLITAPLDVMLWKSMTVYQSVPPGLRPHLRSWSDDFYDLGDSVTPNGDGTFALAPRSPVTVSPAPDAFDGKVAVLIDAGPSSATFYLADTIQQAGAAPLVGQTTGGSLKGLNGGQMVFLTLPHTGFAVDVPLYGSRPGTPGPDRGVAPDVLVEPNVDAIVARRDPELEAALALLGGCTGGEGLTFGPSQSGGSGSAY